MDNENTKVGRKAKNDLYNAAFAVRLRKLFEENNVTQSNIAEKLGTTRQTIGNWLLGKSQPDFETLVKLADHFETTTDYLLGRTDAKTVDTDIRAVCDYIGLSETAVDSLRSEYNKRIDTKNSSGEELSYYSIADELFAENFVYSTAYIIAGLKQAYIQAASNSVFFDNADVLNDEASNTVDNLREQMYLKKAVAESIVSERIERFFKEYQEDFDQKCQMFFLKGGKQKRSMFVSVIDGNISKYKKLIQDGEPDGND